MFFERIKIDYLIWIFTHVKLCLYKCWISDESLEHPYFAEFIKYWC